MRKKSIAKRILMGILILALVGLTGYNLYVMYKNIDVSNSESYEAERTAISANYSENVENVSEKNETTADMLEDVTQSVVGISRLKDTGGSILNNISSDELGLGTGIVVSDNGYILSNSHVTGEKYSTCYVTIDENTYKGNVVWSDSELDLSITKIQAINLKYVTFGDSKNLRVGEQVFAIGNPIRIRIQKNSNFWYY